MPYRSEQIAGIEAAMAAQEQLRPTLGHELVEITLRALRARLADLRGTVEAPATPPAPDTSHLPALPPHLEPDPCLNPQPPSPSPPEAERRQVTVLFADIVGFTSLSETLDAEEVVSLTNEILIDLAETVSRYDGHVDKFMGDSIMALFGAPVAHEDDAERALRAALEMRARIASRAGRHQATHGRSLALHIGINSGPVIAGHVGSVRHGSYTVMGDTVNIAARLEKAARPGQILLSNATRQLAGTGFILARLPPLSVKGKGQPLLVYELHRTREMRSRTAEAGRLAPIFIGREQELARLRVLAGGLETGRGRLVIISGEAGIGKSRLVAEWRREQAELNHKATWLKGRCHPTTTTTAYGPFLDLLRRYTGIARARDEQAVRHHLARFTRRYFSDALRSRAVFVHLLAIAPTPEEDLLLQSVSARALRQLVAELLEDFFAQLCRTGPVVLLLEDLHWSDPSSLELLERLAGQLAGKPCTMVAVTRPAPTPGHASLWQGYPERLICLKLPPLSPAASRTLIRRLLTLNTLPQSLRRVVEKTEGNPFFLAETLRTLIDNGALARNAAGVWEPTRLLAGMSVPDTLQGLLMSRLDSLPGEAKRLAQQAAVIGRSFPYRILGRIAIRVSGIDLALGAMERVELIGKHGRTSEVEYIFRHALIQEVAYGSLLVARRRELHRRVGEAMREIFADRLGEFSGIIGEHFLLGEAWEEAAAFLTRAGEAAGRIYAHAEARSYHAKALAALAQAGDSVEIHRLRVDATVKLAKVSYFGCPPRDVLENLRSARLLAEQLPDPAGGSSGDRQRLAQIDFHTVQLYYSANRMREALGCYREVLAATPGNPEQLRSHAFALGNILVFQGHMGQAQHHLELAMTALAGDANNHFLLARARAMRAYALIMTGDCRRARSEARTALRVGLEIKSPHVIAVANLILSASLVYEDPERGVTQARRPLLRAREMAREADDAIFLYLTYGVMAWNLAMGGQYQEAEQEMDQCRAMAAKLGEELFMVDMFTARRAEIVLGLGRAEEARTLAEQAIAMAETTGGIWAEACARRTLARILSGENPPHLGAAASQLAESIRLYREGENWMGVAQTRIAWGTIRQNLGDYAGARQEWQQAAEFFAGKGLGKRLARVQALLAANPPTHMFEKQTD